MRCTFASQLQSMSATEKFILTNFYWEFTEETYETLADFEKALEDYYTSLEEELPEATEVHEKAITIFWELDSELMEETEVNLEMEALEVQGIEMELEADNGEFFTDREIVWKINNLIAEEVENHDAVFFEGLLRNDDSNPPFYWLMMGS